MIGEEGPATTVEDVHDPTPARRRMLGAWFRAAIDPGEAEGMASRGHRPMRCGGCTRRGCPSCDVDPAERVYGRGSRSYSADPVWVRAIVARTSRFPRELVTRAQPALAALPPDQRIVLLLAEGQGLTYGQVAHRLKVSPRTVSQIHHRAIQGMLAAVWPPDKELPS